METLARLTAERLGVSSKRSYERRKEYFEAIVTSIIDELERQHGIVYDDTNHTLRLFIVDLATYRYQAVSDITTTTTQHSLALPRHLLRRLHNLILDLGDTS